MERYLSRSTGRMVSKAQLEQEYIDAVKRLRIYEKNVLKRSDFRKVEDQIDLANWIRKITKADGELLAKKAFEIDEIQDMIAENIIEKERGFRVEKSIETQNIFTSKRLARKNKGIYQGYYYRKLKSGKRRKIFYSYDFKKKKRVSSRRA